MARPRFLAPFLLLLVAVGARTVRGQEAPADPLKALQLDYVAHKDEKLPRAFHFGSQGPGDVFSNHTSHTNRLIPVYTFGKRVDLGAYTGVNSPYRDAGKIRARYDEVPPFTLNPEAEYADQSDLARLQLQAASNGARQIFLVLFDGMDWVATRAAAMAAGGKVYSEGKGTGLNIQDFDGGGTARYGYVVTSSTHAEAKVDLDGQKVAYPENVLRGGYDARFGGLTPWAEGPLAHPAYFRGQSATKEEREAIRARGGVMHAYTDSAASAAEIATGVKTYNDSVNVGPNGQFLPTVFEYLQGRGWGVGVVTSVPFNHASPAAMYARNVHRDDYQDLARDMVGLRSIAVERGAHQMPGLDVVIGAGWGKAASESGLKDQGANAVPGNLYITDSDLAKIDVANGGKYVVATRQSGVPGAEGLMAGASKAAAAGERLFGFYGYAQSGHLPYRTADGRYDPTPGIKYPAEEYAEADLKENPTLADMTRAALEVLGSKKDRPFALFMEPGDVDWGLHDNNLDAAVGATLSGCEAVQVIFDWIEKNSSWDDAVVIVTADHGHYLVIDDPAALAGAAK